MTTDAPQISHIAGGLVSFLTSFSNMIAGEIAKNDKKYLTCELVWDDSIDLPNMNKVLSNQLNPQALDNLMKGTLEMVPGIKKVEQISTMVETKSRRLFVRCKIELDNKTTVKYQPPKDNLEISYQEEDLTHFKWLKLAQ
jgi:hypothetical protein